LTLLEARQPLELPALLSQSDLPERDVHAVVEALIKEARIIRAGQTEPYLLYTAAGWQSLIKQATDVLQDYHRKYSVRPGMPKSELGSRLKLGKYTPAILEKLIQQGVLGDEGLSARLASFQVQLNRVQQEKVDAFLKSLARSPYAPPAELIPEPDLLNLLIEQRKVVKVSDSVIFSAQAYNEMVEKIIACIKAKGKVTLGEVRDLFQTSRKYAQALMEYLDEKKVTKRVGDERVLY
jgi:selenocysteine-specific elongation factor